MSLRYVDEFVIVPERMYKQLAGSGEQEEPPSEAKDYGLWSFESVIDHLPKRLVHRGRKLLHILQTALDWDDRGRVINNNTSSPIEGSHIADLLTDLLSPSRVRPPGHEYVARVVRESHVPAALLTSHASPIMDGLSKKPVRSASTGERWLTFASPSSTTRARGDSSKLVTRYA